MFRVLFTVLLHGLVFIGLWWRQTQDSVAEPDNFSAALAYWQNSMSPLTWGMLAFMLLVPSLALLSSKRQSIRGRGLLLINWLFVPVIVYIARIQTQNLTQVWLWWLVFSVAMFGGAIFNGLSARVAQVPQQVGKK